MHPNINKQLIEDIYKIGIEHNDSISIEQLQEAYEKKRNVKINRNDIVCILNLLENLRFCFIKNENNVITTKMRNEETIKKLKKLSDVDYLIYTKVENSQMNGIWTADIRKQTKFLIHQVQKGVKLLCENKLIKQVNNIHVKNRKMYILYDLEASKDIIGGSFYTDGEFNKKAVDLMRNHICFYLYNKNNASVNCVINYIKEMDNSFSFFTENEIYRVIKTLLYEGKLKIYKNNENNDELLYYYGDINLFKNSLPCFSCEIFDKCNYDTNTPINPKNCIYLNAYLNLDEKDGVF